MLRSLSETSGLVQGLLHREVEFLYGSKPIAAGQKHIFQLGAGKYACRGLFKCSLRSTREGLVAAIEFSRLQIGELLLAEEVAAARACNGASPRWRARRGRSGTSSR